MTPSTRASNKLHKALTLTHTAAARYIFSPIKELTLLAQKKKKQKARKDFIATGARDKYAAELEELRSQLAAELLEEARAAVSDEARAVEETAEAIKLLKEEDEADLEAAIVEFRLRGLGQWKGELDG